MVDKKDLFLVVIAKKKEQYFKKEIYVLLIGSQKLQNKWDL